MEGEARVREDHPAELGRDMTIVAEAKQDATSEGQISGQISGDGVSKLMTDAATTLDATQEGAVVVERLSEDNPSPAAEPAALLEAVASLQPASLGPLPSAEDGAQPSILKSAEPINAEWAGSAEDFDTTPRFEFPGYKSGGFPENPNRHYSQVPSNALVQDYFTSNIRPSTPSSTSNRGLSSPPPSQCSVDVRPDYHREWSNASTITSHTIRASQDLRVPISNLPMYPNQSYSALHMQNYPPSYIPRSLRSRDSNASTVTSRTQVPVDEPPRPHTLYEPRPKSSAATSPASTPGLYTPRGSPGRQDATEDGLFGAYSSPYLHYTQRHVPKETHRADIDVDPISGRKMINHYEIVDELGRGVHGKVKLGRDLDAVGDEEKYVAIKIVERFSRRKRLGKSGSHEDKIKREIAILKKARHPNIVGLLEVIDDPKRKKVYIVLEHVELGEVRWRAEGAEEICQVEWRRHQRELLEGSSDTKALAEDDQIVTDAQKLREKKDKARWRELNKARQSGATGNFWSHEYGGETDNEDSVENGGMSRTSTRSELNKARSRHGSNAAIHSQLEIDPTLETAIHDEAKINSEPIAKPRRNTFELHDEDATIVEGVVASHETPENANKMSRFISADSSDSELSSVPEHFRYVPLMELEEARSAFRDTILGLEFLHYQGVVHRDIKPANLLQAKDHTIKISDFGVSYLGKGHPDEAQSESDAAEESEAVELAKTVGTPAFYAPELCRSEDANHREPWKVTNQIDIWALGVTLYCLIYGRVPFHDNNSFALMRCIAEDEVHIPKKRLKAIDEHASSKRSSHGRMMYKPRNGNHRLPHDLDYDDVDEDLRDLLKRLFIKDPGKRIKLEEVKHHPWVLQGINDPAKWMGETDPSLTREGKHIDKIEVSKEDVEEAVAPLSLVDRVRSVGRKVVAAMGISRNGSRRRPRSSTTSLDADANSAASSTTDVRQDSRRPDLRRPSLKPEDIALALKASRDPADHPLSQSVTASPDLSEAGRFYDGAVSRPTSPSIRSERSEATYERRPGLVDRTHSAIPIAGTQRISRLEGLSSIHDGALTTSALPSTPSAVEGYPHSALSSIFGGARERFIRTVRSRERNASTSSTGRIRGISIGSRNEDAHGEPSLGLSHMTASGKVNQPDALRDEPYSVYSGSSMAGSQPVSRAGSIGTTEHIRQRLEIEEPSLSRNSSQGSMSHARHLHVPGLPEGFYPHGESEGQYSRANPISNSANDLRLLKAQEERIRRRQMEQEQEQQKADRTPADQYLSVASSSSLGASTALDSSQLCPPSPDDLALAERQRQQSQQQYLPLTEVLPPAALSSRAPRSAPIPGPQYPSHTRATGSTSSEDRFPSAISHSTLHPSDPSVISAASSTSLVADNASDSEEDDDGLVMGKSASWPAQASELDVPSLQQTQAHQQQQQQQHADQHWHTDNDATSYEAYSDDDEDYEDDEDEGFIEMARYKSNVSGPARPPVMR